MLTLGPVVGNPFEGSCVLPAGLDPASDRAVLEMEGIEPEQAAAVRINGSMAGGFIGKPFRLDVTRHLNAGENRIRIEPLAPRHVRLLVSAAE